MSKLKGGGQPFIDALRSGALVGDGGMGTQLYERGMLFSVNYEELNLSRPDVVRRVHEDYLHAGADLIETNTFGANSLRLARQGIEGKVREINLAAVNIAKQATSGKAYIAGAIGPSGLILEGVEGESARVRAAFKTQAEVLAEGGVDLLIIETMRHPQEILLAVDAAREAVGRDLPIVAQVSIDQELAMADGTSVLAIGEALQSRRVDAIGVNCSNGPQDVFFAVEQLVPLGLPVSAMPNAGLPRRVDERLIYVSTPEYFGLFARRMFKLGVRLVGGCCGTTPEHIRRIAASARMAGSTHVDFERAGAIEASYAPPTPASNIRVVPTIEKSRLAAKISAGHFAVSVEVNPPLGLDTEKSIAAAKMLVGAGVDVINIADGARAQARMSNVALAVQMQSRLGIETIVHVCGRDRNLLGQVAHLLGAQALGIKNLVIITGDPPKLGDFPDATAVYDLDSVGILRLVAGLNRGIDPGGKPLGAATSFYCATGAEPAALNYEREMQRLKLKIVAGAELIMTQPVYDPGVLNRFLDDVAPLGIPVLVGLLPLASHRNAEFLHNEVPGMQVPESIRERMRKAGSGPSARKEGVGIAREMLAGVRSRVAGAYIMPPLERYELALEVIEGFLDKG
ncbi:MAG TPA: bifunctional homocysteine S-methyltransferase/methylenetetrahydrofolate reductase [Polyangiaceae bacterium]